MNQNELYVKLDELHRLIHIQKRIAREDAGPLADASKGQGRIIALLKLQPEMSSKQLSYLLNIRQQSLNESLIRMEKAGLIERKPSEKDRRIILISLTEKGRSIEQQDPQDENILEILNEEQQKQLYDLIEILVLSLKDKLDGIWQEEFARPRPPHPPVPGMHPFPPHHPGMGEHPHPHPHHPDMEDRPNPHPHHPPRESAKQPEDLLLRSDDSIKHPKPDLKPDSELEQPVELQEVDENMIESVDPDEEKTANQNEFAAIYEQDDFEVQAD